MEVSEWVRKRREGGGGGEVESEDGSVGVGEEA